MKTEIDHCKHYHPDLFARGDNCPVFKKEYENSNELDNPVDPVVTPYEMATCLGYWNNDECRRCPFYEE